MPYSIAYFEILDLPKLISQNFQLRGKFTDLQTYD